MTIGFSKFASLLGCAAVALSSAAFAADAVRPATTEPTQKKEVMARTFRASEIEKMSVRNSAGDKIGTIEDLVIDARSGKVSYAALGFGGFLGVGEKLFAVPWTDLHVRQENKENYIRLNVSKNDLSTAPGFDKNNWPDFADPNFTNKIDEYYKTHRVSDEPVKLGQQ